MKKCRLIIRNRFQRTKKRRREPVARLLVEKDDDDDDDIYTNNNGIITTENWRECVILQGGGVKMAGNSGSFLNFFDDEVNKKHTNTIDDDDDDDDDEDKNNVLSQMLTRYALDPRVIGRLVGGAVHPLIHLGYACELFAMEPETSNLLLAEALAMQCTTRDQLGTVVAALEPLAVVNEKVPPLTANNGGNRILQVLQEMQQDEALANVPTPENPDKVDYIVSRTDVMSKYYNSFPISESSSGVQLAFEQLYFAALVIVFGSVSNIKEPRLDFFLAHLLTSAVSLRQVLPFLDVKAGGALCRLHYCAILVWYRARGHPSSLNMANLLKLSSSSSISGRRTWPTRTTLLTWEACEIKLRENPGMEVHALKVFRALQLVKSEEWAERALMQHLGGGAGTTTTPAKTADDVWLVCANVLVQNVERDPNFPWLFEEAWDYYNS
jgi:Questin oxidase-like